MKIDIITIFPEIARVPLSESMMLRAQKQEILELNVHDLRDWTKDKHRKVDDEPFGGGPGMVMKPEPFFACVEELRQENSKVILLTPQGTQFVHRKAAEFAQESHLIFLCGHYEGIDQRVMDTLVDEEISIGDFVLTNGALAAAVVVDAVVRLIPGVLGDSQSAVEESFAENRLDWPQYTRPAQFRGLEVPAVLRSGDHQAIQNWRLQQAVELTRIRRPDLLDEGM